MCGDIAIYLCMILVVASTLLLSHAVDHLEMVEGDMRHCGQNWTISLVVARKGGLYCCVVVYSCQTLLVNIVTACQLGKSNVLG